MQFITTVTQKGQVTLPKKMREALGIQTYDNVLIEKERDYIKIKSTEDILDLAGMFKPRVKKPLMKARIQMEKRFNRF